MGRSAYFNNFMVMEEKHPVAMLSSFSFQPWLLVSCAAKFITVSVTTSAWKDTYVTVSCVGTVIFMTFLSKLLYDDGSLGRRAKFKIVSADFSKRGETRVALHRFRNSGSGWRKGDFDVGRRS